MFSLGHLLCFNAVVATTHHSRNSAGVTPVRYPVLNISGQPMNISLHTSRYPDVFNIRRLILLLPGSGWQTDYASQSHTNQDRRSNIGIPSVALPTEDFFVTYKIPVPYASMQQSYSGMLAKRMYEISGERHLPRWDVPHPCEEFNKVRTWPRSPRNSVNKTLNPCDC